MTALMVCMRFSAWSKTMDAPDSKRWGACFDQGDAPIIQLSRCYRSTTSITRLCNALLPFEGKSAPFGRDGDSPAIVPYDPEALTARLERWRAQGHRSIAVITRSLSQARALAPLLPGARFVDDAAGEMLPDGGYTIVSNFFALKGLEFDAVCVVWPGGALSDADRRMLYTACSRALHALCLMTQPCVITELGIVL
jgi:DNA helicase-2/ATP-dependent DNA helicase PcrA